MTVLKVPDMHCAMCVARITKALKANGMTFTVDLDGKTVSIEGDESAVAQAMETLDDLGFPAAKAC